MEQNLSLGPPRVKALADGNYEVQFAYRPKTRVETVRLAGDFNDSEADGQPMQGPDAEGRYTARVELPAGDYMYQFVLDGDRRRVDPGNPVRDDQQQKQRSARGERELGPAGGTKGRQAWLGREARRSIFGRGASFVKWGAQQSRPQMFKTLGSPPGPPVGRVCIGIPIDIKSLNPIPILPSPFDRAEKQSCKPSLWACSSWLPLVTGDVETKKSPEAALGRQITGFELHDYLGAVHKLDHGR